MSIHGNEAVGLFEAELRDEEGHVDLSISDPRVEEAVKQLESTMGRRLTNQEIVALETEAAAQVERGYKGPILEESEIGE